MGKNKETIVSIEAVSSELGNRVYKLNLLEGDLKEGCGPLTLDLSDHPEQSRMFSRVADDYLVEIKAHICPDLSEQRTGITDLYYVWQSRFARSPMSCPRCKYRFNNRVLKERSVKKP